MIYLIIYFGKNLLIIRLPFSVLRLHAEDMRSGFSMNKTLHAKSGGVSKSTSHQNDLLPPRSSVSGNNYTSTTI
jgi:hypothetical protein